MRTCWKSLLTHAALAAILVPPAFAVDRDNNPPGPAGGPGTNWENPPGPKGGPGTSADRTVYCKKHPLKCKDRDNNPPGPAGGSGTNWENPPGPQGGAGTSPNRR
jgi:hypothetical protein